MNRALRAAAVGVLLLSPVALSACSAGQVAQTSEENRDKVGGAANVGPIALRQAEVAYPVTGAYQPGGDARLIMAVVNTGDDDDTLVSITGEDFKSAAVTGGTPATPAAGGGSLGITIPANSNVYIGGNGPVVSLTGLIRRITAGNTLQATVTFKNAGSVPVQLLVANPPHDVPRGEPFDFDPQLDEKQQGGGAG